MKSSPVPQAGKARADAARFQRIRSASVTDAGDVIAAARPPTAAAVPVIPEESEVVWVYAVTSDIDPARLSGLTGVAGEPVRLVTDGGLSAVVGSVRDTSSGEKTLPSILADLSAIEAAGLAHHRVISRVAGNGPVLPLRLATVYANDETIAALLARRHAEFTIMLESFRGTQEWDVKVYLRPWKGADDHVWPAVASADLASADAARGPGQVRYEVPRWTTLEACAEELGQTLRGIAVATRRCPSPLPSLTDDSGWIVLNNAYLVDTKHASQFSETVASVTAAHSALRAVITGPWPPYSFADQ